jgi:hypothetical protein
MVNLILLNKCDGHCNSKTPPPFEYDLIQSHKSEKMENIVVAPVVAGINWCFVQSTTIKLNVLRSFDRKKTSITTRAIIKTSDAAIPVRNSGMATFIDPKKNSMRDIVESYLTMTSIDDQKSFGVPIKRKACCKTSTTPTVYFVIVNSKKGLVVIRVQSDDITGN